MKTNVLSAALLAAFLALPGASWSGEEDPLQVQRPLNQLEPHYRKSVIQGWRIFQTSFAKDGMACVNCHRTHVQMTAWAGGYPKVEVFDGTPYSVKTLRQVVLETLEIHTDLPEVKREAMADNLAAYISWWGDGQLVKPGISRDSKPAFADLYKLKVSVNSGRNLFYGDGTSGCTGCHSVEKGASENDKILLKRSFPTFPRYSIAVKRVLTMDSFLVIHIKESGSVMNRKEIAALSSFLADVAKGQILRPGELPEHYEAIDGVK